MCMGRRLRIICKHDGMRVMVGGRTEHLRKVHGITDDYRKHFDFANVAYYYRIGKNLIVWVYESLEKEGGLHIKVRDSVERTWSETILSVEETRRLCRSIATIIGKK